MWGRNGLRLTCCCGLTWFLLAFVGTHCHAMCACSLARFLLAYAGSRCHAALPTGTWLDLVPFQHRYLGIAPAEGRQLPLWYVARCACPCFRPLLFVGTSPGPSGVGPMCTSLAWHRLCTPRP